MLLSLRIDVYLCVLMLQDWDYMGRLSGRGRGREFHQGNELCRCCHNYLFCNETLRILPVLGYPSSKSFPPFLRSDQSLLVSASSFCFFVFCFVFFGFFNNTYLLFQVLICYLYICRVAALLARWRPNVVLFTCISSASFFAKWILTKVFITTRKIILKWLLNE